MPVPVPAEPFGGTSCEPINIVVVKQVGVTVGVEVAVAVAAGVEVDVDVAVEVAVEVGVAATTTCGLPVSVPRFVLYASAPLPPPL